MKRVESLVASTAACVALLTPEALARHDGHEPAPHPRVWRDERNARSYSGELLAATATHVTLALSGGARVQVAIDDLAARERAQALAVRQRVEQLNAQPLDVQVAAPTTVPWQSECFRAFAPHVRTSWDARWLRVESDGLPHEPLAFTPMVGIRTWQQQVPLPQPYSGASAWLVPLQPRWAETPISARTHLRRGAIALAANGIPIFNALNNRGADAFAIGELDEFGGHCGRADDYHYHTAPLALAKVLGPRAPLGFALDGFALYGLFDPRAPRDAARSCPLGATAALDEFNGHALDARAPAATYHYHASEAYPYINGGLRGVVELEDDQVVPQPRAAGVRPAQAPLRGARITSFAARGEREWALGYELGGQAHRIEYSIDAGGAARFTFVGPDGARREELHRPRERGRPAERGSREDREKEPSATELRFSSPAADASGVLDRRYTCDGAGESPPFAWSGLPSGTRSVALTLHHVPPEGGEHVYLVLWGLPAELGALAVGARDVGVFGLNSVDRRAQYAPPCSQGPGEKEYIATLYALSAEPKLSRETPVARAELLAALRTTTLASEQLVLRYARQSGGERRAGGGERGRGGERAQRQNETFPTEIPKQAHNTVLARPGATTLSVSVQALTPLEARVRYGARGSSAEHTSPWTRIDAPNVQTIELSGLKPNTEYDYVLETRGGPDEPPSASEQRSFATQRAPGHPFVFALQADSHLDENMTPAAYERTLANVAADRPDFFVDLGDTFMTDKYGAFAQSLAHYEAQRYYFGLVCHSAPLLMVLGNHDGEAGYAAGADGIASWSYLQRTQRFPQPRIGPDSLFSGDTDFADGRGANHYAFEWGDALFVVLDPFWPTRTRVRGASARDGFTDESWARTLGREQYDWLERTLRQSRRNFRFVFTHHLVGGRGREARGGVESAPFFEWGGKNADGSEGFAEQRAGWAKPIHALLVEHGVNAVFHGHDHLFVHSELDGVVYQCVPQPGNERSSTNSAAEYGYASGTILASPGHLRIHVSAQEARVEFVRSAGGATRRRDAPPQSNRQVAHSYSLAPRPRSK